MLDYELCKERKKYFAFLTEGSPEHADIACNFLEVGGCLVESLNLEEIIDSYCYLRKYIENDSFEIEFLTEIFMEELKTPETLKNFGGALSFLEKVYLNKKIQDGDDYR